MKEFYRRVDSMNLNCRNLSLTVIEGESFGEKAFVSDGKLEWTSSEEGFFQSHKEAITKLKEDGVLVVDGIKVFCEILGSQKKLVICGGGYVAIAITRLGKMIGCHVTVLEDRPKFADNARRAGADQVICETFEQGLSQIEGDRDTFFIIVTRGHVYDQICLELIVRKPHAYIGMMGSRRRVAQVKQTALERGADREVIEHLYSPIGLHIGAETPEEIAVSVIGEIIEVKNKKSRSSVYSEEMLEEILYGAEEKKVLATIIARQGSAPRSVGTKMLVLPDGRCIDTIGGGCVEAGIVSKALLILRDCAKAPQIVQVDMTGEDAEEEGMVCGGKVQVLLEAI